MPRLTPQRLVLVIAALAGCWTFLAKQAGAQDVRSPHILYIVADDSGSRDVGFHASQAVKTPNIDKLAAGGLPRCCSPRRRRSWSAGCRPHSLRESGERWVQPAGSARLSGGSTRQVV